VVDAVKSSTKFEENEESRVTRVGGMENAVKGSKETRFRRVARPTGGLKFVEVLRRDNRRLEEKMLKNFGNSIEVCNRAVVRGKRLIKTGLFVEK